MVTDISANITFKVPFKGRKILIIFMCLGFISTIDIFSSSTSGSGTGVIVVTRGPLDKICKLTYYPPESHSMDVRGFNFVPWKSFDIIWN